MTCNLSSSYEYLICILAKERGVNFHGRHFDYRFQIHTDASRVGIGAVLSQQGHPIAYLSKALSSMAKALSTYEKECLALILVVEKWKSYLQHNEFIIYTDHKSLTHLESQHLTNSIQHKAFCKLLGLNYR
jgi:hypothetical protein